MTLFSRIFVLLFPFLHPCISLQLGVVITFTKLFSAELLGSRWQVLGIGGEGGGGGGWGHMAGFQEGQAYSVLHKPVFRVSNLHLQVWHCPSNCTLLKAPYKYSNITRTKMSHWRFKLSIWFYIESITYLTGSVFVSTEEWKTMSEKLSEANSVKCEAQVSINSREKNGN